MKPTPSTGATTSVFGTRKTWSVSNTTLCPSTWVATTAPTAGPVLSLFRYDQVRTMSEHLSGDHSESIIVSEGFKGGTRGSPIMPRDAVSRTANVERNGGHKWVNLKWWWGWRVSSFPLCPFLCDHLYMHWNGELIRYQVAIISY